MALAAISDEISKHVAAVVALSRRDVLFRLLGEAELCFDNQNLWAAAILGGFVLEEILAIADPSLVGGHERRIEDWRELRNRAAHPAAGSAGLEKGDVAAMLKGIRELLDESDPFVRGEGVALRSGDRFAQVRGKYAFVPTSVDEFLKRKREDLGRE